MLAAAFIQLIVQGRLLPQIIANRFKIPVIQSFFIMFFKLSIPVHYVSFIFESNREGVYVRVIEKERKAVH